MGTPHATVLTVAQIRFVEGREYPSSIVFRHGLLAMRLASILTIFRKWDDYRYAKEYACTDADFNAAMQIVATILEHSLLLGTTLPTPDDSPSSCGTSTSSTRYWPTCHALFLTVNFTFAAQNLGISLSTAKRILKKGLEQELIVKQGDKYRKRNKRRGK